MATEVGNNAALARFELTADGQAAGYIEYQDTASERALVHTVIFPEFAGQGYASELVEAALNASRAAGFEILPLCPFVRGYITKHPAYIALVPQASRAMFNLPE
ncbi:GNAT family N-acetyltransferase [Nocardia camponoti]|uniref:N-acetyltransferase domain-containing protein n=1 Tax=Nocardia camponoti TaxID=1616106 RepID=A0A917QK54_9NOCA|nr:GNAT family N-acetyltransferase [Nocardia camponoti]GGK53126.1 hypothetical protein GCM10011591_26150 [Nocardia camponoti]